jgi:hypothetical protein
VLGVSLISSDHRIKRCLAKFSVTAQLLENENFMCATLTADHAHHSNGKALRQVNHYGESSELHSCALRRMGENLGKLKIARNDEPFRIVESRFTI